jgi:transposase
MSQTRPARLGIAVALATFDGAVLCAGKLPQRTFALDPAGFAAFDRWVRQQGANRCMPAWKRPGSMVPPWRWLSMSPATRSAASTRRASRPLPRAKSRLARTKTDTSDTSDAALIAHCCARAQPAIWTPPSAEVQELQAWVRLQERLQQADNRRQRGGAASAARRTFLSTELAKTQRLVQQQVERSAALKSQQ